jgi:hypothetical protein
MHNYVGSRVSVEKNERRDRRSSAKRVEKSIGSIEKWQPSFVIVEKVL